MCTRSICLTASFSLLALATSVSADLVGHWPLDGNADDISANGYDGVAAGGVTYAAGVLGSAADFNGSDALIDCGDVPLGDTGALSIACWVRPRNIAQNWAGYVSKWTLDNSQRTFWLGQHSTDGWLRFGIYPGGPTAETFVDSGQVILANEEWTHVTCTYDGNIQRIYADAVEVVASPERNAAVVDRGGNLRFGIVASANWFNGLIDDVRIYNRALAPGELHTVMMGEAYPQALALTPADGSMVETTALVLQWRPGDFAVSHDVYFGESFDEVDRAAPGEATFQGSQTDARFSVTNLTPGGTYYWRIDEINDVNPDSPWKGDIWSFRVKPATAWNPVPADGVRFVAPDQKLTWNVGMGTLFHTVYFGETFDEVDGATTDGMMTADAVYDPGPLEPAKTYYWRVDEFSGLQAHKGPVWSFTTVPEIAVTDPNLIGWWTFEEGQGTTAVDWSGYGHHGVIFGGAQRVDGYQGGALKFDGSDDFVDLDNPPDLPAGTSARSICAWATTDNLSGGWKAAVGYGSPVQSQSNGFARNGSLLSGFGYGDDLHVDNFWQIGVWHHLCLTYDGTTAILYADGVQLLAEAKDWNLVLSRARIGRQVNEGAEFWAGLIDDVRIYDKVLTAQEIEQVMQGDPLLAGNPEPGRGAVVDIRDVSSLSWSRGDTAASHDVYFGTDRDAVRTADKDAPEFQGNQPGTSLSLAGLVEFGGGDYYWRIDEVEADGTVHAGNIWAFTVADYLIVDDFESYDDDMEGGTTIYQTWIDGFENDTGSQVGYLTSAHGTFGETGIVYGGGQSMPLIYDNSAALGISEADRTFAPAQDWTAEGVTTLVVHFRGQADNTGQLYVKINGTKVPYDGDPADLASTSWIAWEIDLRAVGVNLASVTQLTIGLEGGQMGVLYIDEIRLTGPATDEGDGA